PCALARRWAYRPVLLRLEDRTVPSFITAPEYPAGAFPNSVAGGGFNRGGAARLGGAHTPANGAGRGVGDEGDGAQHAAPRVRRGASAPEARLPGRWRWGTWTGTATSTSPSPTTAPTR